MKPYYEFSEIIKACAGNFETIARELFPNGARIGHDWCIGDVSGSEGKSLKISLKNSNTGCFVDKADPSIKGNAIALVSLNKNIHYQEAAEWLAHKLGVRPTERIEHSNTRKQPEFISAVTELDTRSIEYAAQRNIKLATLQAYRCQTYDQAIVFNHFDANEQLCLQKMWSTTGNKNIWSNKNPIHALFGKHLVNPTTTGGVLVITEGQWDAMTWYQLGVPAVSIPSGVNNDDWICEDWTFLNNFTEIYLDFDKDSTGISAAKQVQTRLGHDRTRIISYDTPHKDANEIGCDAAANTKLLLKAFEDCQNAPVEHIIDPAVIKDRVRDLLAAKRTQNGVSFFLEDVPFEFRRHETVLWYGYTGHGKSTAIMNQIAYQASLGIPTLMCSFEDNSEINYGNLMVIYTADPNIAGREDWDEIYDYVTSQIYLYDSMKRTSPQELIATMTQAHKQLGISHFVVDNVMTLDVDRQDNKAQAETADAFRVFVSQYPVNLSIAAHPRKPSEMQSRPPHISEVRGASEWIDMAQNVICVWKDDAKAKKISQMYDERIELDRILEAKAASPDARIIIEKERWAGNTPNVGLRFAKKSKRFYKTIPESYTIPDLNMD